MQKHLTDLITTGALLLVLPLVALAQGQPYGSVPAVLNLICSVVNVLFTILIVVAIVYIILAAFKYLTASGDPEKIKVANFQLLYAAIAVGIGFLAKAIPLVMGNFLGGNLILPGAC